MRKTLLIVCEQLIGIKCLFDYWSMGADAINNFVVARGDIAHRGRKAGYVTINKLIEYRIQIVRAVIDTDNGMADFIQDTVVGGSPWRRRNT